MILSVPDEGYSRNVSCALNLISTFLFSHNNLIFFSAVYLVFILTLGATSVVLTIFVLSLHFKTEDHEIPEWVKTFTNKFLLRVACMQKCGKYLKNSRVEEIRLSDNTSIKKLRMVEKGSPPVVEAAEYENHGLTWKRLSKIMDRVFFNLYMFMIALITAILFLAIFVNYYTS